MSETTAASAAVIASIQATGLLRRAAIAQIGLALSSGGIPVPGA
jgi:hypothetical protein